MRHRRLLINRDDEITDWLVTSRFTWTSSTGEKNVTFYK